MDMLIYLFVILVIGFMKVFSTRRVSDEVSITSDNPVAENIEASQWQDIPIGNNLVLQKDPYAYHYILYDLGLEEAPRC